MDGDYLYAFQRVIMPIALEFNPDFVISKLLHGSRGFVICSIYVPAL